MGNLFKLFGENWQRFLFAAVGLTTLFYSFRYLQNGNVTESSAVFAISFLSFLYSNLSRFKRFKGLGFEAELWEDKQREAADLIEKLKKVVSIYTIEVVMNNVKRDRWSDSDGWKGNWELFDTLVEQHNILGQKIDFSGLKRQMDDYFVFDMCMLGDEQMHRTIVKAQQRAKEIIDKEFGNQVTDSEGYSQRRAQLAEIKDRVADPFKVAQTKNLASEILSLCDNAKDKMKRYFDIEIQFAETDITRMKAISALHENRPIKVSDEIIAWAEARKP